MNPIRLIDISLALIGLITLTPFYICLTLLGVIQFGSPFFTQTRLGKNCKHFTLVKFRTIPKGSRNVPTHYLNEDEVPFYGRLLRKNKLDELPQLWNVIKGEMSLVGPRPCLPIQKELIEKRLVEGVFSATPGITGLAQIRSIDMSKPKELTECDKEMLETLTLKRYLQILVATALGYGLGDRINYKD